MKCGRVLQAEGHTYSKPWRHTWVKTILETWVPSRVRRKQCERRHTLAVQAAGSSVGGSWESWTLEESRDSEPWFSKYLRCCSGRADWVGQGRMKVEGGKPVRRHRRTVLAVDSSRSGSSLEINAGSWWILMIEVNNHSGFLPKHLGEWRWGIWWEKQDSGQIISWILDMGVLRCPKVEVAHKQLHSRSGVLRRDPEAWTRIKPCAQIGRAGFTVRWILKRDVLKGRTKLSV